ncbi:hypothetical protein [Aestuariibaculum marinum]|uniref:Uncharacterized protein n=1 Tax=Aestuariibaculum marinum TaxID=2683592 RepID=A0A8J6Q8N1_9FLAO|nr:hypothetical protein [Aestuariibaculum marinum]MBD0825408.1 hypothetical protein [Aestuariibaculum marinum]
MDKTAYSLFGLKPLTVLNLMLGFEPIIFEKIRLTHVKKLYILLIIPNTIVKPTSLWQSPSKNPNQVQPQPPQQFVFFKQLYKHVLRIRGDAPLTYENYG